MTTPEAAESELSLDSVAPRRRATWRTPRHWSIGVAAVTVLAGSLAWWQASARADVLVPGADSYYSTATIFGVGNAIEYCYPDRPGSTFTFSFSILNASGHDVTVQSIAEMTGIADQKITIGSPASSGSDALEASTQTLPLTIHPGQSPEVYVAMHLSTDIVDAGGSGTYFDSVILRIRALGISRAQKFPLGLGQLPLWIGISGIDDRGKSCERSMPQNS